jgi:fimbrial chaperone protein
MNAAKLVSGLALVLLFAVPGGAASLQVQPALVDVQAPGAASTVTLHNEGQAPITVQIRVFRWSQHDGEETLQPTQDVVASPPAVTLPPNADYVARIVRVVKRPVSGEEAYRLLVDELPDASRARPGSVMLLVRQSIPVFFATPGRAPAAVNWTISRDGGQIVVSAHNKGDSRLRISALSLCDASGKKISFGKGLLGYALGRSTMRWVAAAGGRGFAVKGSVSISAQTNDGTINATVSAATQP